MKSPTGYPEFKEVKEALMNHLWYAGEEGSYIHKAIMVLGDFFCLTEEQKFDEYEGGDNKWNALVRSARANLVEKHMAIYQPKETGYVKNKWILKPGAMDRYLQEKDSE